MPLSLFLAGTTQRDALIDQHVVADLCSLADDDARAVVDEEAAADGGAGVDLDPGQEAAELRDDPRHQRHSPTVQPVSEPVQENRMKSGVAQEDLDDAFRGWIFAKNRIDLFPHGTKHFECFYYRAKARCALTCSALVI